MSANSLETLLMALAAEPDDAAKAYRIVHARLMRFFDLKNMADPGAMADKVMDRLAANLSRRGAEQIESPAAFASGIARHLLQEEWRRLAREKEAIREWKAVVPSGNDDERELTMSSLDHCLDRMPAAKRELLRSYYGWTGAERIAHHRRMADELGVTVNALRNRVLRAREELLACLHRRQRDVSIENDSIYRAQKFSKERRERVIP
jgi:DNA-directed RNA polymerase specialized sigma24 family protein